MSGDDLKALLAIGGLALITLLTRAFFMIPQREIPMPGWLRRGLKYAPLAALTAVIAPDGTATTLPATIPSSPSQGF